MSDSVSNVASRATKARSSTGSKSSVSSTSSARIKAEADMAALIARQRLLKNKHALEEQEEQLRKKREQLDLEMEIVETMAKVNVLKDSEGSRASGAKGGMNSYLGREQRKAPTLNVDAETFVPAAVGQPSQYLSAGDQPQVTFSKLKMQQGRMHVHKQVIGFSHTHTYGAKQHRS